MVAIISVVMLMVVSMVNNRRNNRSSIDISNNDNSNGNNSNVRNSFSEREPPIMEFLSMAPFHRKSVCWISRSPSRMRR